ncbi:MAG: polysaccharide pyruvyl transferase family protein [Shinella sp.]|nr:polysaccharide pyruvyl transferase family protein [Shinella sp.]
MKIGLLGQFGSGNSGNDGSLEAMLNFLRKARPDAELLCFCSNPSEIQSRYDVRSFGISSPPSPSRWFRRINGIFANLPHRFFAIQFLAAQLGGLDLLIIPGTGILDDYQESPMGWPFVIYRWCIAAKLRRVRVAFVSVGAGPIDHPLSRWLFRHAARSADYRSFRDGFSRRYIEALGVDVSQDREFPDIAFRLPLPAERDDPERNHFTIGVGVMNYRGWSKIHADATAIYRTYIGKIAAFVLSLIRQGFKVRLLTGDIRDRKAVDDVLDVLKEDETDDLLCNVSAACGETLHSLMEEILQTDMVVVSRYHNVVCALKTGRPVISIGYAQKNEDLLASFLQSRYCQHIETFDVETLTLQFQDVLANYEEVRRQIADTNARFEQQLAEQEQLLLQSLLR